MPLVGNSRNIATPDVVGRRLSKRESYGRHYSERKLLSTDVKCANGFHFGIRVGKQYACEPQNGKGPWTHVEMVGPNRSLSVLRPYLSEDRPHAQYAVYERVPVELLNRLVSRNGGEA